VSTTGHPSHIRTSAISLLRNGADSGDVAAKPGVPKGTAGYWKHLDRKRRPDAYSSKPEGPV
jgi:hypothetical protein